MQVALSVFNSEWSAITLVSRDRQMYVANAKGTKVSCGPALLLRVHPATATIAYARVACLLLLSVRIWQQLGCTALATQGLSGEPPIPAGISGREGRLLAGSALRARAGAGAPRGLRR